MYLLHVLPDVLTTRTARWTCGSQYWNKPIPTSTKITIFGTAIISAFAVIAGAGGFACGLFAGPVALIIITVGGLFAFSNVLLILFYRTGECSRIPETPKREIAAEPISEQPLNDDSGKIELCLSINGYGMSIHPLHDLNIDGIRSSYLWKDFSLADALRQAHSEIKKISNGKPICLDIDFFTDKSALANFQEAECADILCDIRSVEIIVAGNAKDDLTKLVKFCLACEQLQVLEIGGTDQEDCTEIPADLVAAILSAISVREVHFYNIANLELPNCASPNITKLEFSRCGKITPSSFFSKNHFKKVILRPMLNGIFGEGINSSLLLPPTEPPNFPELEKLNISVVAIAQSPIFFEHATFPKLKSISLDMGYFGGLTPAQRESVFEFLEKVLPHITKLTLHHHAPPFIDERSYGPNYESDYNNFLDRTLALCKSCEVMQIGADPNDMDNSSILAAAVERARVAGNLPALSKLTLPTPPSEPLAGW
ncbi:MAG: hypothetical protein LBI34_02610 [Puniceicoccales bacterium]|jgi:hypothetical protein|nr:hypothetical protein [Puniceicoccales bacterium]